jgi:hypothetical protein
MISNLVAVLGVVSVVLSLLFTAWQTRQLTRQTRINNAIGSASAYIGSAQLVASAHAPMVDHPSLRSYFYDGKACNPEDPNRARVLTVAELIADACEYGLMMANYLPLDEQWREYPRELLGSSPILRQVVLQHHRLWPRMASEIRRLPQQRSNAKLEEDGEQLR